MTYTQEKYSFTTPGKSWLLSVFLFFLFLLLYGSVVPFEFQYIPFAEAISKFKSLMAGDFVITSSIDFSTNVLLTIPITFCLVGMLWPSKSNLTRLSVSLLTILVSLFLTFTVEFAQLYVPGRTPSLSDVTAQITGAFTGCLIWWVWGKDHWPRFFIDHEHKLKFSKGHVAFYIYTVIMFVYNLLPLDIAIEPADIYQKWATGKIILIPFSHSYHSFIEAVYELVTDIALWIPITFLLVRSKMMTTSRAWIITIYMASFLEFLQLLIFSRVTDLTDIITAAIGASLAVIVLRYTSGPKIQRPDQPITKHQSQLLLGLGLVVIYSLCLAIIFWFPYDFTLDSSSIKTKLKGLSALPFKIYYQNAIFFSITSAMQKVIFFMPLGMSFWVFSSAFTRYIPRTFLFLIASGFCTGAAMVIELGQLALPNKVVDSTDLILQALGGISGYWITHRWIQLKHRT